MEAWITSTSVPEYEVSSLGRIRCLPTIRKMPRGGERSYGGRPWLGSWDDKNKRYILMFRGKTYRVGRMVCEAFHGPPPADKPLALHSDENGRNNQPDNLRWGDHADNMNEPIVLASRPLQAATQWHGPGDPLSKVGQKPRPVACTGCGWKGERVYADFRGCPKCQEGVQYRWAA